MIIDLRKHGWNNPEGVSCFWTQAMPSLRDLGSTVHNFLQSCHPFGIESA